MCNFLFFFVSLYSIVLFCFVCFWHHKIVSVLLFLILYFYACIFLFQNKFKKRENGLKCTRWFVAKIIKMTNALTLFSISGKFGYFIVAVYFIVKQLTVAMYCMVPVVCSIWSTEYWAFRTICTILISTLINDFS